MKETDLHTRRNAYLARREALGLSTRACQKLLQNFVAYLEKHGAGNPLRAQLAVDWACSTSATCGASGQAARLGLARGFLTHLNASLPETEIPDKHLLAAPRRPQPYILSAAEISRLLEEAARTGPRGSLRPHTHQTLFGLLASTGLRPSEAAKRARAHGRAGARPSFHPTDGYDSATTVPPVNTTEQCACKPILANLHFSLDSHL